MFDGVEHVAIASLNPGGLAQWYVEHLAFRTVARTGGAYFVKAPNGVVLEIINAKGERTEPATDGGMYDRGLRHMAIAVSDFDGALASLRGRGVNFLGEPYASPQGNRLVFFTDCEGNILHLIQRVEALPE
jgi:glyoxylase I family protein